MKRTLVVIVTSALMLAGLCISDGRASEGKRGTYSAQFLKFGLGGRAIGMGGAFAGLADDVSAVYWNPAGLAGIDRTELGFMHQSIFQDISYEYFAYAQPLGGRGVLGWGMAYLHMDKLTGRDESGEFTSDFGSSDIAVALSYGRRAGENACFGMTVKFINENIDNEDANAFAVDLGWLYRIPVGKIYLGGVIQNLGQDIKFVSESYGLPRLFKLGAAYKDSLAGSPLNVAMDLLLPSDNNRSVRLGTEYVYRNVIAARIGYNGGSESNSDSKVSLGLGVIISRAQTYRLDYAFVPAGDLGDSHTLSVWLRF